MRWRFVEGYGEKYKIYENGVVVSLSTRYQFNGDKCIVADYEPHILKPYMDRKGYLTVGLYDDNGKAKMVKIHRLVALAFIPNPDNKRCVCHKDNDKTNNNVDNLYWGTDLENNKQAWHDGLIRTKKAIACLSKDGKMVGKYDSATDAARILGINQANISACAMGKRKTAGGFAWHFLT